MDLTATMQIITYVAVGAFIFLTMYTLRFRSQSGQPLNLASLLLRPFSRRSPQPVVSSSPIDGEGPKSPLA